MPGVGQGVKPTPQVPEMTIDETSWLKERTAQVQRQESDALVRTFRYLPRAIRHSMNINPKTWRLTASHFRVFSESCQKAGEKDYN